MGITKSQGLYLIALRLSSWFLKFVCKRVREDWRGRKQILDLTPLHSARTGQGGADEILRGEGGWGKKKATEILGGDFFVVDRL